MYYGLISDIHSNLSALTSVLNELEKLGVDEILCLGDIVGYAADPGECIDLVRERSSVIVAGNHDSGTAGKTTIGNFNEMAVAAIEWTQQILEPKDMNFLEKLPLTDESRGLMAVHASPSQPDDWPYIFSRAGAMLAFEACENDLIFIGHTHRPCTHILKDGSIEIKEGKSIVLKDSNRYLVNIGSVGQPRDGDPRSSFVTYRTEENTIEFHRQEYDIKKTQDGINRAKLPSQLASRLSVGY